MTRNRLMRSVVKLGGVALLLVAALMADVQASTTWCEQEAADCAQQCGTSVHWGNMWSYWDSCYDWNAEDGCIGGMFTVNGVIFTSGVHNFECIDYPTGYSYCQCAI